MTHTEALLAQIDLHPAQSVGYIGLKDETIIKAFNDALQICDGTLHLYLFNQTYISLSQTKLKIIKNYQSSFKIEARLFDQLFLFSTLSEVPDKDRWIKKMFRSLENSGNIIIIENKKDFTKEYLLDLVEKHGFLAGNDIDIFEDKWLINAKKMHGWGYGL